LKNIKIIISALTVIFFLLTLSSSAFATLVKSTSNYCVGATPTNCFVGGIANMGSGVTGASATITMPSYPAVYLHGASNGWVGIALSPQLVQVGWIDINGQGGTRKDGIHYFIEQVYSDNTNSILYSTVGPAEYSSHFYDVHLSSGGTTYLGYVDNVQIGGFSNIFTPNQAAFLEEINANTGYSAYQAAFAGTSTNHVVFSTIAATKNGVTTVGPTMTTWYEDGNSFVDNSHYNSPNTFEVWDTRY
jgi:hypothetical protein